MDKIQKLKADCADEALSKAIDGSLSVLEKCFSDYSADEVTVCFNGGKDCIVMLHLVKCFLAERAKSSGGGIGRLQAFYVRERDPFPEVEEFVRATAEAYNLDLVTFTDSPLKESLAKLLRERPKIKATVLGTRKGDPGSQYQDTFSATDGDWPRVMRVNPILHWEYGHVWSFIRGLSLEYPSLYDKVSILELTL